jgi:hypothetical protein
VVRFDSCLRFQSSCLDFFILTSWILCFYRYRYVRLWWSRESGVADPGLWCVASSADLMQQDILLACFSFSHRWFLALTSWHLLVPVDSYRYGTGNFLYEVPVCLVPFLHCVLISLCFMFLFHIWVALDCHFFSLVSLCDNMILSGTGMGDSGGPVPSRLWIRDHMEWNSYTDPKQRVAWLVYFT